MENDRQWAVVRVIAAQDGLDDNLANYHASSDACRSSFIHMMASAMSSLQTVPCARRIMQERQHGSPAMVTGRSQPTAMLHTDCPVHVPFRAATLRRSLSTASRPRTRFGAAGVSVRAEQSYVMIKPDGVQRGLVRTPSSLKIPSVPHAHFDRRGAVSLRSGTDRLNTRSRIRLKIHPSWPGSVSHGDATEQSFCRCGGFARTKHSDLTLRCAPQVGEVISRFERKGFKLIGLKMHTATRGTAEEHYRELSAKPFFKDLVDYIISGPVICMVRACVQRCSPSVSIILTCPNHVISNSAIACVMVSCSVTGDTSLAAPNSLAWNVRSQAPEHGLTPTCLSPASCALWPACSRASF